MRVTVHAGTSLVGGLALGLLSGSWLAAGCSVLSGVFLDLDHLVEYGLARRAHPSVRDFSKFWREYPEPRVFLWLHSGELLLVFAGAAWGGIAPAVTGGLAFGLAHHLLLDQLGNGVRWGGYFLLFRWALGFQTRRLFNSRRFEEPR